MTEVGLVFSGVVDAFFGAGGAFFGSLGVFLVLLFLKVRVDKKRCKRRAEEARRIREQMRKD